MRVVEEFPHEVEEIRNAWIPMPDGVKLAARLWLPAGARKEPVPAILEYIPYRKTDRTSDRDALNHPYFAGHGYAAVRVDLRGSGDSGGVLTDEYLEQELADGEAILRWIAEQDWCNGRVGIIGISWGGFNGLQLAARRPPELAAVISVCSTDDRYADDVHYMGGCLLGDNLSWASYMFAINSLPPDRDVVGERWRELWFERLEHSGLWLDGWLRHQHRDDYWKHGSICEDFSRVQVPVLAVSGWADGYSNAVFRMMEKLECPRKGLVGPWSHKYPHQGVPGPAIGFLQECVRWWDHWLKGEDRGIDEDPCLRVWMQDSIPPHPRARHRPGRWVAESAWPSDKVRQQAWQLGLWRLHRRAVDNPSPPLTICSPLSVGLFAGKWCSYAAAPDLPHDQRQEDGGALIFDSFPLEDKLEIMGAPEVELSLSVDRPVAMVAVRLSDLDEEDRATRVTYGLLNLTHRDGHEQPQPLEVGQTYRVRVRLNDVAQVFPAGHRLRIAISTCYWPLAWPPPEQVRMTIDPSESQLHLPVREPRSSDEALRTLGEPESAPPAPVSRLEGEHHNWLVSHDLAADEAMLTVIKDEGRVRYEEVDLEVHERTEERYSSVADEISTARGEVVTTLGVCRGDWDIHSRTRTVLTATVDAFHLHAELDAYEGEKRVYSRNWNCVIPRNLV